MNQKQIKKDKVWLYGNYCQNRKRGKVMDIKKYVKNGRVTEIIYKVVLEHYGAEIGCLREYFATQPELFFYDKINNALLKRYGGKK